MRLGALLLATLALAGCPTTPTDSGSGRDSAAGMDTGDSAAETPTDNDGDGAFTPDDCDDTNPAVNPDGDELLTPCDGLDNDCDGRIDDGRRVPADYALPSEALAAAEGGDLICVAPGTYVDNLDFGGKDVQMIGVQGPESTILMGASGGGSVVTFQTSETPAAVFTGFTVSGGDAEIGAGVNVDQAAPTLYNLVVRDNTCHSDGQEAEGCVGVGMAVDLPPIDEFTLADLVIAQNAGTSQSYCSGGGLSLATGNAGVIVKDAVVRDNSCNGPLGSGGGMYTIGQDVTLKRVVLAANTGETGGGLAAEYSIITLQNVAVVDNVAGWSGGAEFLTRSWVELQNVWLAGNRSERGGAALALDGVEGEMSVTNVDVVGNVQEQDGSPVMAYATTFTNLAVANNVTRAPNGYYDADAIYLTSSVVVTFSNFWNNGPAPFGDQPSPVGENGNLAVDPGYTDLTAAAALDWDLHLRPGSALIDQGDPNILDADGSRSDIGAFGGPGGLDW